MFIYSCDEYEKRVRPLLIYILFITIVTLGYSISLKQMIFIEVEGTIAAIVLTIYFYLYIVSHRLKIDAQKHKHDENLHSIVIDKYPSAAECLLRENLKNRKEIIEVSKIYSRKSFILVKCRYNFTKEDKNKTVSGYIFLLRSYKNTDYIINHLEKLCKN